MTRLPVERLSTHHQVAVRRQLEGEGGEKPQKREHVLDGVKYDSGTELKFAVELEARKMAREIKGWRYHSMRFWVAPGRSYEPDFLDFMLSPNDLIPQLTIYEVKGSWESKNARDSRTRLEACAALNWWFKWRAVTRENGIWRYETI